MTIRPPNASSHARVRGEKYALGAFVDVRITEYAKDAMITAMSTKAKRNRSDDLVKIRAVTRKMVG